MFKSISIQYINGKPNSSQNSMISTLQETNSSHLKMEGWKTIRLPFGARLLEGFLDVVFPQSQRSFPRHCKSLIFAVSGILGKEGMKLLTAPKRGHFFLEALSWDAALAALFKGSMEVKISPSWLVLEPPYVKKRYCSQIESCPQFSRVAKSN